MKFITSRIISSSQTRSLLDIINDNKKQTEEKKVAAAKTVTAAAKTEVKVAAKEEKPVTKVAVKETAPVVAAKTVTATEKTYKVKEVVASKTAKTSMPQWVFKKVAKLSKMDETFLRQYYSVYYPKNYVEALIAKY